MINKNQINLFVEKLKENNISIGAVESFTGGLFAATLTSIPGVSKVFKGSIVSYHEDIKETVVGVNKDTISKYTVVSSQVAEEMAYYGSKKLNTDLTISFTGNAGPSVCDGDKPVGLIYISLYFKEKFYTFDFLLNLDRNGIREEAINIAVKKFLEIWEKNIFLRH